MFIPVTEKNRESNSLLRACVSFNPPISLTFATQSGELVVTKKAEYYELNFPVYATQQVPVTSEMEEAIGVRPLEAWLGRDLVCILPHENDVIDATPDFDRVKALDGLLLNITARGENTILSHVVLLQNCQSRKIQFVVQGIVMSFLYGLVSWNKQNLRLSKLLREAEFLFVAWREIGFTLQEKLPSIAVARFM